MIRTCLTTLLAALLVTRAPAAAPPGAGDWLKHLETNLSTDSAARERAWRDLAQRFPVIADWLAQDLGPQAIDLLDPAKHGDAARRLAALAGPQAPPAAATPAAQLTAYLEAAEARRHARLSRTLDEWGPIAFTESHSFRMSFIGYTEGLSDARAERFFEPGTRLAVVEFPKGSTHAVKRTLIDDPHGMMRDVDVSFDRTRLAFAWKQSDRLDDYHIHEWDLAKGTTRQLTTGLGRADYEPAYLPDGDLVFASTRPEQSVPCWWTEISNLYRMDGEGRYLRRLAIDQVHALYPQVMADGRVTYTRWDYNDRGQNFPHPVFSMRPDGQDQRAFYGGNSWFPNSLLHTRGIPGSHKAMSIAAGHHTYQQGKLVVLDPKVGRDEGKGMSFIAPRREVAYERVDRAMQDGDQFRHPFPFSEEEFLVSHRPAWGATRFGLYWMNAEGHRELLHADTTLDVARMVALGRKPAAKRLDDTVDYHKKSGTYYVKDVYQGVGLEGIPRGSAKKIRVVKLDYRAAGVGKTNNSGEGGGSLNSAPVAVGNGTWDVKQVIGDADIHADGSALFEVPAMASIYLQVLDAKGRVIQTSRTWDTLRPGETKGCRGCHDKTDGNHHPYQREDTEAWRHGVQTLQPFRPEVRGFSFAREIQPILDAKCISCHDGSKPELMDLRGTPVDGNNLNLRAWSRSYLNLVGAVREDDGNYRAKDPENGLVSWISKMSRPTEIPPYFAGAAKSRLLPLLEVGHHGVTLDDAELRTLATWMDLLVPFSGDYREGNAWNPGQMAYYRYYEGKRETNSAEEQAGIKAFLARHAPSRNAPAAAAPQVPAHTRARYRDVLKELPFEPSDGRLRLPGGTVHAMIDRVWLSAASTATDSPTGPLRVRLTKDADSGRLAELELMPGEAPRMVLLSKPVRSDRLQATIEGAAPSPVKLRLDRASGVLREEVPVVDGYHPFLEL